MAVLQAYQDYNDLMRVTEEMVSGMVKSITGSYKVHYHMNGPDEDPVEVNFEAPWRRIPMISGLEKHLETKFPTDLDSEETRLFLIQLVRTPALLKAIAQRPLCARHRTCAWLGKVAEEQVPPSRIVP